MGVIKILDENLSNMIAAGEVIENPASLIKELLENSLDAGSTFIKIDIKNGGKTIKFIDDGKGMSREDLLLCIERHATSKISSKDDLFNLTTYGFRGEALSSIAAVSKMVISTKRKEDSIGNSINISGGKITNLKEIQKSVGTEIEINNLFFNTPVRLKFLRKDSTENSRIRDILLQEAIANPEVSINLSIDGKESIRTNGKGLENTILEIFGISILKNLKAFSYGYIGNLSLTRSNRDSIYTFVNSRPVKSKIMEEAIIDAYYTKLMKGRYPFVIINYIVDPKTIDVNVHPSKKVVKFADEKKVYDEIYAKITETLNSDKSFNIGNIELQKENSYTSNFDNFNTKTEVNKSFEILESKNLDFNTDLNFNSDLDFNIFNKDSSFKDKKIETKVSEQNSFVDNNKKNKDSYEKITFYRNNIVKNSEDKIAHKESSSNLASKNSKELDSKELDNKKLDESENEIFKDSFIEKNKKNSDFSKKIKIIGQFSDSFILTEEDNELIIYDQHIVHERILYEKLKKEFQNQKLSSQQLLVPIKVTLTPKESVFLKENLSHFKDFGFEIDYFSDNDFLIRAVPSLETKNSFENIFFEVLENLKKTKTRNEIIENMIISMSCRGAVKANEKLSHSEMEKLIIDLHEIGEFTCPHGRPITFKLSLLDMEKGFKRK